MINKIMENYDFLHLTSKESMIVSDTINCVWYKTSYPFDQAMWLLAEGYFQKQNLVQMLKRDLKEWSIYFYTYCPRVDFFQDGSVAFLCGWCRLHEAWTERGGWRIVQKLIEQHAILNSDLKLVYPRVSWSCWRWCRLNLEFVGWRLDSGLAQTILSSWFLSMPVPTLRPNSPFNIHTTPHLGATVHSY